MQGSSYNGVSLVPSNQGPPMGHGQGLKDAVGHVGHLWPEAEGLGKEEGVCGGHRLESIDGPSEGVDLLVRVTNDDLQRKGALG